MGGATLMILPLSFHFESTYLFFIKPEKNASTFHCFISFQRFIWLSFSCGFLVCENFLCPVRARTKQSFATVLMGWFRHCSSLLKQTRKEKDSDAICLTTLFRFVLECFMFWILLYCRGWASENLLSALLLGTMLWKEKRKKCCT